jgi:hypothetical protein
MFNAGKRRTQMGKPLAELKPGTWNLKSEI